MAYTLGAELTARWEAEQLASIEAESGDCAELLTRQAQAMRNELQACAVGSLREYLVATGYWATLWRQFDTWTLTLWRRSGCVLPADAAEHAQAFGAPDGISWHYNDSMQSAMCRWEAKK